jgi:hypothetical protein
MNYLKCFQGGAALLLALCMAGCGAPANGAPARENVLANRLWDDGKAELSMYEGTVVRYGHERPAMAQMVVVKEDLIAATLVKSDSGPVAGRTLTAIKLNWIVDFQTGTYRYHQMATVQFRRDDFAVLKETMSSTEGCGITFVRIGPKAGRLTHETHSYWEGEADREVAVDAREGALAYLDAMPVALRAYVKDATRPFELQVRMMPGQIAGRSPITATQPVEARIQFTGNETLTVPAGTFRTRHFVVTHGQGSDQYWFAATFPYAMIRTESSDGRRFALKKTQRIDYWRHTAPGDERLLE